MQVEHLDCVCNDMSHHVRFTLDDENGDLILEVHLEQYAPWWRRVINAVRYVFNRGSRYGHYECTIVKPEDYVRLRNMLAESEDIIHRNIQTLDT